MVVLLPRLPSIAADHLLDEFLRSEGVGWRAFEPHELPDTTRFAPTGGTRASAKHLRTLREGILEKATSCGLGRDASCNEYSRFDNELAGWLADSGILASGEALRDDFWSFVGVVMAPDVVHWRFGNSRERYFGGVRNTFQRLWLRGRVLDLADGDADRWGLLSALTEDAFVQIAERPSIGGNPTLARAVAEAWVRAAGRFDQGRMEPIMRRASLHIRIQNEIRSLSNLSNAELALNLDKIFDAAAEATERENVSRGTSDEAKVKTAEIDSSFADRD